MVNYRIQNLNKGVTLLELIIALSLMAFIIIVVTNLDQTIRQSFRYVDIQAQLLNEVSPAIQHMTKHIMQGIGSLANPAIDMNDIAGDPAVKVRIDSNNNGMADALDTWIAYRFYNAGPNQYQILYCSAYLNPGDFNNPLITEVIGRRIFKADFDSPNPGVVSIDITSCQDPDGNPIACGNSKNPIVNLKTNVSLRAASVR